MERFVYVLERFDEMAKYWNSIDKEIFVAKNGKLAHAFVDAANKAGGILRTLCEKPEGK